MSATDRDSQELRWLLIAAACSGIAVLLCVLDLTELLPALPGVIAAAVASLVVLACYRVLTHHTQREPLRLLLLINLLILISRLPALG